MVRAASGVLVGVLVVGVASCGGSDAEARPTSWKPFCSQLREIKAQAKRGWSFPGDPKGLKTFDRWYKNLEKVSPSSDVAASLKAGRPALVVRPDDATVRAAIPAAKKLKPVVTERCGLELADVFKVGGY